MAGSLAHHAFPVIQDFGSSLLDWQCKGSGVHGAAALLRQSRQGAGPMEGAACGEHHVQAHLCEQKNKDEEYIQIVGSILGLVPHLASEPQLTRLRGRLGLRNVYM